MSEICDMIYGTNGNSMALCGRPAIARTVHKGNPWTKTGHVRYCKDCHKTIGFWGVETEPWPKAESE